MNTDPTLGQQSPLVRKDWRSFMCLGLMSVACADIVFIVSMFVMGGEFWGKFRRIFVWEGRV